MLNHITIMGRLTRDPELRYTQSQTPVASFTLAVDRDFGGRDGGEKQTDFIDCVAWRSTAEFVSKYFAKGSMAVVSGRLQIRDWTARAASAAAQRSLSTTCISAKASAAKAATCAVSPVMLQATTLRAPRRARRRFPSLATMTANCRFKNNIGGYS